MPFRSVRSTGRSDCPSDVEKGNPLFEDFPSAGFRDEGFSFPKHFIKVHQLGPCDDAGRNFRFLSAARASQADDYRPQEKEKEPSGEGRGRFHEGRR